MTGGTKVGRHPLTLHQGYCVLAYDSDGQIRGGDRGIYYLDTRLVSGWTVWADDVAWTALSAAGVAPATARAYYVNGEICIGDGGVRPKTVGLVVSRHVAGGLHEDLDLTNYGLEPARFTLRLTITGDFSDIFEVKASHKRTRGTISTGWVDDEQALVTRYTHEDFSRAFRIAARRNSSTMRTANGDLCFDVELEPGAAWHACLHYDFADGEKWNAAPASCVADSEASYTRRHRVRWREEVVKVEAADPRFENAFARSLDNMAALRLPIEGTDELRFVPAAGLPWYAALFGRDSLIVSLQTVIVHPQFSRGTLRVLGEWQARERDDYRDAEPGKIPHELRRGELAHFKLVPHTPYYGTADATPLYLITLHSAWKATGDRTLLEEHMETAERCLGWIEHWGDRDGDGLQEYQTRSSAGYENQGWKDSGEAIVYPDGTDVAGPKATCELQGYAYDALRRSAELYDAIGDTRRAAELRQRARQLYQKFNDCFWMEREGFYALALDGNKRRVESVASNPGHCLWSRIVPPERAHRVADRLMRPDMWSGWGIRTLSATHRKYNPYGYQIGAVWPHDNGLIALGLRHYGFDDEALRVIEAIVSASDALELSQLPELYAGVERTPESFPVWYAGANVPQGWAAGSMFSALQVFLGFQPDAPNRMLYVDPVLPAWLPELLIRDLRVGDDVFEIRLTRRESDTAFEVVRGPAERVKRRKMSDDVMP